MSIITDPLFYMVAIPALIALGLSKGGFAGVGVIATPLTALYLPPLEAAALILPVLIVQDAISVWWYRRDFDPWNLKVMLPGALVGMAVVFLSICCLAFWEPVVLLEEATPDPGDYHPEPEWYFLFLFQMLRLKIFAGEFGQFLGAVAIPGAFMALPSPMQKLSATRLKAVSWPR